MNVEQRNNKKAEFLTALNSALGIVTAACQATGVPIRTYYNWYAADEDFREACDEVLNTRLDFVESKLLENIRDGDTTSIIFYLKTKGKHRGYTERLPAVVQQATPVRDEHLPAKDRNKLIKAKKDYIVRLLKQQGKYTAELSFQATVTAELMVKLDEVKDQMSLPGYQPIKIESSREGDRRESLNPLERYYVDVAKELTRSLKALGMNLDSKERKPDTDGYTEFMSRFNDDGDEEVLRPDDN